MKYDRDWKAEFEMIGAHVRESHFKYTKGGHGPEYVDAKRLYLHPILLRDVCAAVAASAPPETQVVIGPERAGIGIAAFVALALSESRGEPCGSCWAEKDPQRGFEIRKAFSSAIRGRNVVVAEDVVNSSKTSREVVEAALRCGARVTSVVAIWNRGGEHAITPYGIPIRAMIDEELVIYPPGTPCPLCARGVPMRTDLGHGGDPQPNRVSTRPPA